MPNDNDKVPAWTEPGPVVERLLFVGEVGRGNQGRATIADLRRAAEAAGLRLVTEGDRLFRRDRIAELEAEVAALESRCQELELQRGALLDAEDHTEIGRVRGRLCAHDWDVDESPAACVDRMAARIAALERTVDERRARAKWAEQERVRWQSHAANERAQRYAAQQEERIGAALEPHVKARPEGHTLAEMADQPGASAGTRRGSDDHRSRRSRAAAGAWAPALPPPPPSPPVPDLSG